MSREFSMKTKQAEAVLRTSKPLQSVYYCCMSGHWCYGWHWHIPNFRGHMLFPGALFMLPNYVQNLYCATVTVIRGVRGGLVLVGTLFQSHWERMNWILQWKVFPVPNKTQEVLDLQNLRSIWGRMSFFCSRERLL